jgi:hypothetical protein
MSIIEVVIICALYDIAKPITQYLAKMTVKWLVEHEHK